MDKIRILDKDFRITIMNGKIREAINRIADSMNNDMKGKEVIFLGVLNGAFMFMSDLLERIEFDCEISFVKMATYEGSSSTGNVKVLIGIDEKITDKTVIIVEDIIDSGVTMDDIIRQVKVYKPGGIKIATLLIKPSCLKKDINPDYIGFEVPDEFVVGYGLDYKGFGRNLKDIYTLMGV